MDFLLTDHKVITDKLIEISPAVEFPVAVNGKSITAKITHAEENWVQYVFHVQFSDGYKSEYMFVPETGLWHDVGQSTPSAYGLAIQQELVAINKTFPLG